MPVEAGGGGSLISGRSALGGCAVANLSTISLLKSGERGGALNSAMPSADSGGADWRRPATSHPPNSKATATAEAIAIFFRVNSMRHPVVAGQNTTTDLKKRCD